MTKRGTLSVVRRPVGHLKSNGNLSFPLLPDENVEQLL